MRRLDRQQLIAVLLDLATSSPLSLSLCHALLDSDDDKDVVDGALAEILQLRIWFDSSRLFEAWASSHTNEKVDQVMEIADRSRRHRRFARIGRIYKEVILLMLHFTYNSTEMDAEASVHLDRIMEDMSSWQPDEIPRSDMHVLRYLFRDGSMLSQLQDIGYAEAFKRAVSGWMDGEHR